MIILAVYFVCIIYGFFHGVIKTFLPIFVIILLGYFYLKVPLPDTVMVFNKLPVQAYILKLFICVVIFIICLYIIHKLTDFFDKFQIITVLDRILGGLSGFILATLVVYGISYLIIFFYNPVFTANSRFYPYLERFFSTIIHYVKS
jgi:uncharacterized membrane protein required for colicin V production